MEALKGACIFGQSGGPTSVINASASGVFQQALKEGAITKVYGAAHGIKGVLTEQLFDMGEEDIAELELLKTTPSSALGSVRYKLADPDDDDTDYQRMLEVFKKYDVRYFFYNGGNDSMDTCNKISKFMQKSGYEMRVMGVPKTIDNDLWATDHCPGFGSAAKYIATTMMEIYQDARVYDRGTITIVEIMGRNAGWLTASAALAGIKGAGPDLIYLPEREFDMNTFLDKVQGIYDKTGKVIVAVSEGVRDADGKYISEYGTDIAQQKDSFGHSQLGGLAYTLSNFVREKTGAKVRAIEFSLMQRCAAHVASRTDYEESFLAGQTAVKEAVAGKTDYMVGFKCGRTGGYKCKVELIPLNDVANKEKKIPDEWITQDGVGITQGFIDYALPLIQGETELPKEDGLPRFAKLKKVLVKK